MSSTPRTSVKEAVARGIRRRYAYESVFRALGLGALLIGLGFLAFFFYTIISNGYTALVQTRLRLDVMLDPMVIDPSGSRDPSVLAGADYQKLVRDALGARFPEVTSRSDLRALYNLVSPGAGIEIQRLVAADPRAIGTTRSLWLLADDDVDVLVKGHVY